MNHDSVLAKEMAAGWAAQAYCQERIENVLRDLVHQLDQGTEASATSGVLQSLHRDLAAVDARLAVLLENWDRQGLPLPPPLAEAFQNRAVRLNAIQQLRLHALRLANDQHALIAAQLEQLDRARHMHRAYAAQTAKIE